MSGIWCRSDPCMALCQADDNYHPAVIARVNKNAGRITVTVKYDGYDSQGNEELGLDQIKPIPDTDDVSAKSFAHPCPSDEQVETSAGATSIGRVGERTEPISDDGSIFSPLSGQEEASWKSRPTRPIGDDVIDLSESRRLENASRLVLARIGAEGRSSKKLKPPLRIVSNGAILESARFVRADDHPRVRPTPSSADTTTRDQPPTNVIGGFQTIDGFDEQDVEKPKLASKPPFPKVPFVLSSEGEALVQVPATINQYLRDYQRDGVSFLYQRFLEKQGGILADDMGLGKTIQVIGFLSAVLAKSGTARDLIRQRPSFIQRMSGDDEFGERSLSQFLIVCPGSVLYNWLDEFDTWGYFSVGRYHQAQKDHTLSDALRGKLEIVVTTFETLREHISDLKRVNWTACIVDEVHKIKGSKVQVTVSLGEIRTRRRYGLTGTALQNNMAELWCILDWANPGCLGSAYAFGERFSKIIERGQKRDASKRELAEARRVKEEFSEMMKTWVLRRMKTLIADQLPKKDDRVVFCRLTTLQSDIYRAVLSHDDVQLVLHRSRPCTCGSDLQQQSCCYKANRHGRSIKSITFSFLHLLVKVSNHVALLIPEPSAVRGSRQSELADEVFRLAFREHQNIVQDCRRVTTSTNPEYCGKMKVLQGMLKVFKKEEAKVLLFSYSTRLLDIIEQYVLGCGYEYRRLDGRVKNEKRQDVVREFNRDSSVFLCLVSTKAGGVGLNLTGANVVVIYDPNWNPAHDLQAQDRAYRLGQRRDVRVYRLITSGTIEENMYLRQIYKQQLDNVCVSSKNARRYFHAVQDDVAQKGELFGIENMFALRTGDQSLTETIINRNKATEVKIAGYDTADYVAPICHLASAHDIDYQYSSSDDNEIDDSESFSSSLDSPDHWSTDSDSNSRWSQSPIRRRRPLLNTRKRAQKSPLSLDSSFSTSSGGPVKTMCRRIDASRTLGWSPQPSTSSGLRSAHTSCLKERYRHLSSADESFELESELDRRDLVEKIATEKKQFGQSLGQSLETVSQVFERCDVVHIHANKDVIGASRAEDHMSRCAIRDVFEIHACSQEAALNCEPMPRIKATKKARERQKLEDGLNFNGPSVHIQGDKKIFIGQTPKTIKREHFEAMAKLQEVSVGEFARRVVTMTSEERAGLLIDFYRKDGIQLPDSFVPTAQERLTDPGAVIRLTMPSSTFINRRKMLRTPVKSRGVAYESATGNDTEGVPTTDRPARQSNPIQWGQGRNDAIVIAKGTAREYKVSEGSSTKNESSLDPLPNGSSPRSEGETSRFAHDLLDEMLATNVRVARRAPSGRRMKVREVRNEDSGDQSSSNGCDKSVSNLSLLDEILSLKTEIRKRAPKRKTGMQTAQLLDF